MSRIVMSYEADSYLNAHLLNIATLPKGCAA